MSTAFLSHLSSELEGLKSAGLYKSERVIASPQSAEDRGFRQEPPELLRQQLPRPRRQWRASRCGQGGARPLWLRHGLGALHLRHAGRAQATRSADFQLPRHGGHDPLRLLLRRQWRTVRDAAWRGGRGHFGCAESRLDHRRRQALQGKTLPLRQQRYGRPRSQAEGGAGQPLQVDRHRRRVFDGRDHRRPQGRLRSSR